MTIYSIPTVLADLPTITFDNRERSISSLSSLSAKVASCTSGVIYGAAVLLHHDKAIATAEAKAPSQQAFLDSIGNPFSQGTMSRALRVLKALEDGEGSTEDGQRLASMYENVSVALRAAGTTVDPLDDVRIALFGRDAHDRKVAIRTLHTVFGSATDAYDMLNGSGKYAPTPEDGEGGDDDGGGEDSPEDVLAKFQGLLATARQYADKHGIESAVQVATVMGVWS